MWLFDLFFLSSVNLICRDTDISKYFRESLKLRDNESRLYLNIEHLCSARVWETCAVLHVTLYTNRKQDLLFLCNISSCFQKRFLFRIQWFPLLLMLSALWPHSEQYSPMSVQQTYITIRFFFFFFFAPGQLLLCFHINPYVWALWCQRPENINYTLHV